MTAVDKAMIVLTNVLIDENSLNLAALCRRTGLAKATVHRLLRVMQRHGVVARLGDKYVPGRHLSEPGHCIDSHFITVLRRESTPYLVDLHRITGEYAAVCLLAGDGIRQVNEVFGHRSCGGTSISNGVQRGAVESVLAADDVNTDPALSSELAAVRLLGAAQSQDTVRGTTTVAVPVHGCCADQPPVALSVTGRTATIDPTAIAKVMRRNAFDLGRVTRAVLMAERTRYRAAAGAVVQ